MSAALKLALEGAAGNGNDDVMVNLSILPSSLESVRDTLMLGTMVEDGKR
jgi:hypothetical protein